MQSTINNLNGDYITRDKYIFGEYNINKYCGGVRRFNCRRATLQHLVANNFGDEEECQNYSPSIKEFLDITEGFEEEDISFQCYAVSPKRDDYRITVEGVSIKIDDKDYDSLCSLVSHFRSADEFSLEHGHDKLSIYAWWD